MKNIFLFMFSVLFSGLVLIGCNTENSTDNPISTDSQIKEGSYLNDGEYLSKFGEELRRELALVKSATARYQNIDNAIEDGYLDIDLYIPNMGWHFLKEDLITIAKLNIIRSSDSTIHDIMNLTDDCIKMINSMVNLKPAKR